MATIFEVSKYILQKKHSMTTMKLQKLAYYCQAWSLAWDDKPLFEEDFQAWANGPVCPALYYIHKGMFAVSIDDFAKEDDGDFTRTEIDTMDSVLEFYGDKDPMWLSELTHKEAPWKNARKGIPAGEPSCNIITKESMQQYYGGLAFNG